MCPPVCLSVTDVCVCPSVCLSITDACVVFMSVTIVIAKGYCQARCEMQGLWNNLSQVLQGLCGG